MSRRFAVVACGLWALVGCGSSGAGPGGDGGPLFDGGSGGDGGAFDGGPSPDGGSGDGGVSGWKILPGQGLDVVNAQSSVVQLRTGGSWGQVRAAIGDGAESPVFADEMDRVFGGDRYYLFFANTDQTQSGDNPTLTNADLLRVLTAGPSFPGTTPEGIGPGSIRTAWLDAYGGADLTLEGLVDTSLRSDHYFERGLVVTFAVSDGRAQSLNVFRPGRRPNLPIQLQAGKVGAITASDGQGSGPSAITQEWGEADQVDDFTVFTVAGRNYIYVTRGVIFATQGTVGLNNYTVRGVIFFDPYYGKTDVAGLGVRSLRSEFEAAFASGDCAPEDKTFLNLPWRIYRRLNGVCGAIRLGVNYDTQNRATLLYLRFPTGV